MTDSALADAELRKYYAARAREYEKIYEKPERQADLRKLEVLLPDMLAGRRVLELACGTGYWTQFLIRKAEHIVAVDASPETLELAVAKELPSQQVEYQVADVYELSAALGTFDGAFAGFWWSHVPVRDQPRFLKSLDERLRPGARIALLDNRYVEGNSTPISHRDDDGNTFQRRRLDDGSEHVVLKNFPTEQQLRRVIGAYGRKMEFLRLQYYWVFCYEKA
ncbi:MAG TPA: class I SAM-dependent methyltransferase [Burkholderiales bacterium]|nr:class I SAM-dependent methyltransferase [Burkholderiales bacterium]